MAPVVKVTQQSSGLLMLVCGSHKPLQPMREVRTTHQTLTTADREVGGRVASNPSKDGLQVMSNSLLNNFENK